MRAGSSTRWPHEARVRAWLDETHGAPASNCCGISSAAPSTMKVGAPGEWQKLAAGLAAISVGRYSRGYALQAALPLMRDAGFRGANPQRNARGRDHIHRVRWGSQRCSPPWSGSRSSQACAIAWRWPDCRCGARQIFLAKSGALLLAFAVFVLALNLPWAAMFAMATEQFRRVSFNRFSPILPEWRRMRLRVLQPAGLQGILLNVLPGRAFERVSLILQAVVFVATLGLLPLLGRQPAAPCGGRRYGSSICGNRSFGVPGARAAGRARHGAADRHFGSCLSAQLPPLPARPARSPAGSAASDRRTGVGSWLLERWIGDPRQQAAFAFIWKTLARSRRHRLILLAYGGIAFGAITKSALDMPRPSLRKEGMYGLVVVLAPLAVAMLVTVGLRYLFALPEAHRANWIFPITDRDAPARRGSPQWNGSSSAAESRPFFWSASLPRWSILRMAARRGRDVLTFFTALLLVRSSLPSMAKAALHLLLPSGSETRVADTAPVRHCRVDSSAHSAS